MVLGPGLIFGVARWDCAGEARLSAALRSAVEGRGRPMPNRIAVPPFNAHAFSWASISFWKLCPSRFRSS